MQYQWKYISENQTLNDQKYPHRLTNTYVGTNQEAPSKILNTDLIDSPTSPTKNEKITQFESLFYTEARLR